MPTSGTELLPAHHTQLCGINPLNLARAITSHGFHAPASTHDRQKLIPKLDEAPWVTSRHKRRRHAVGVEGRPVEAVEEGMHANLGDANALVRPLREHPTDQILCRQREAAPELPRALVGEARVALVAVVYGGRNRGERVGRAGGRMSEPQAVHSPAHWHETLRRCLHDGLVQLHPPCGALSSARLRHHEWQVPREQLVQHDSERPDLSAVAVAHLQSSREDGACAWEG